MAGKSKTAKATKKSTKNKTKPTVSLQSAARPDEQVASMLEQLRDYTGRITQGLMGAFLTGSAIPLVHSDNWLADLYLNTVDPSRESAMHEAGDFLRDAREVAGLSVAELSQALGLKDKEILDQVEGGNAMLPFDIVLRMASLVARHDPIPFILKFLRTYNPGLEKQMDSLGVSKVPKHFERERRLINIYRKHDVLRDTSDEVFEHIVKYQEQSLELALQIYAEASATVKAKPKSRKK